MSADPDVMIRVPAHVRDRLAVIAEAQHTSIRALVSEYAESTLTPEERGERAARTRAYLAQHFGYDATPDEEARIDAELDDMEARFIASRRASWSGDAA